MVNMKIASLNACLMICGVILLTGCQTVVLDDNSIVKRNTSSSEFSEALHEKVIKLSLSHPHSSDPKFTLVSIDKDSLTTIRLASGGVLKTTPGQFFPCKEFGTAGLELVSVVSKSGKAVFRYRWCEVKKNKR